jgi:polyisoprenoid-binding protein YceI
MAPLRAAIAASLLLISAASAAAETYELDGSHTYPTFTISHAGLSTLHGRFDDTRGRFMLDRESGNSSVEAVIKVASLDTGHEQRDKILLGEKFFDAARFPEMRFVSTRVEFVGDSTARVDGELTLHGITQPVRLQVEHLVCLTHPLLRVWACGFDATATIKRSDFGMTAYLPKMVGDEVRIEIAVEAQRKEAPGPRR